MEQCLDDLILMMTGTMVTVGLRSGASRRHGESVVYIIVRHLYSNSCT